MNFVSTRGGAPPVKLSAAITTGLAPDGGLYAPESLPTVDPADFGEVTTLPVVAASLLRPFFAGDALENELDPICAEAFDFPAPLRALATPRNFALELFHGPTAAFKDLGARFLAACLARLPRDAARPLTILAATSGDTGAAVASAFHGRVGLRVIVLYPDRRVSPRQAHQLGAFGGNVMTLRVAGTFDDCQRLVKQALGDVELQAQMPLTSANSISLGRLLPQMAYYAAAALAHWRAHGEVLNFVVPTGNLGNALAAILARAIGLPLGQIVFATNANDVLPRFFAGADYVPRPSIATLANAMDVGAPSNFERLRWLWRGDDALRRAFHATAVDDATIRRVIAAHHTRYGDVFCPHTATAAHVLENLRTAGEQGNWCIVATAHPAKFETVVEPLVGCEIPPPPALATLLQRPSQAESLATDYDALKRCLIR